MTTTRSRSAPIVVLGLALAAVLAACGGASPSATASSGPTPPSVDDPTPVPLPDPTAVPGAGGGGAAQPGQGGGIAPVLPVDPGAGGGADDPAQATMVGPVAGAFDVRDVAATGLWASVDGSRVTALLTWWSGVEPCNVLAGVDVVRDGTSITLTVREGSAARDVACIEIAMLKATTVDLGELEPGTYTLIAAGTVAPVEVDVPG
jgi:hypothetical protein